MLADQIINIFAGDIRQTVMSARQQRGGLEQHRYRRELPGLVIEITFNNGHEALRLTAYPENLPSSSGSVETTTPFVIKVPFTGFPVPGLGATSTLAVDQQPSSLSPITDWPFQWNAFGPIYPFDPAFTPGSPGPTSKFSTVNNAYVCTAPIGAPDFAAAGSPPQIESEATLGVYGTEIVAYDGIPIQYLDPAGGGVIDGANGVPNTAWCAGVGGTAALTAALSGKEYWEVEIVTLPAGNVPDAYLNASIRLDLDFAVAETANPTVTISTMFAQGSGYFGWDAPYTLSWPAKLDAFGTPLIGLCTAAYLPDDLVPSAPGGSPKPYMDYNRVLGCDPVLDPYGPKSKIARSIYMTRTAFVVDHPDLKFKCQWNAGAWEYQGTDGSWFTDATAGATSVPGQVLNGTSGLVATTDPVTHVVSQSGFSNFATYYAALSAWSPDEGAAPSNIFTATAANAWAYLISDNPFFNRAPWQTAEVVMINNQPSVPLEVDGSGYLGGPDGVLWEAFFQVAPSTTFAGYPSSGPGTANWPATVPFFENSGLYGFYWSLFSGLYVTNSLNNTPALSGMNVRYTPGVVSYNSADPYIYPTTRLAGDYFQGQDWKTSSWTLHLNAYAQPVQDLWTDGYHAPVFIGRVDNWNFGALPSNSMSDGVDAALDGSAAHGAQIMGPIARFTGVDLGDLKNGDVVMVAADAAAGYVWFGKNGVWYGPGDQTTSSAPLNGDGPSQGTKWAAVMDGCTASSTPAATPADKPMYFPAVGWRVGPMECKLLYGSNIKYPIPAGFKGYGST